MVPSEPLAVRVGNGRKAHLFVAAPGAGDRHERLREHETVHDYVLCGASGALRLTDEQDVCRTCAALRDRGVLTPRR